MLDTFFLERFLNKRMRKREYVCDAHFLHAKNEQSGGPDVLGHAYRNSILYTGHRAARG